MITPLSVIGLLLLAVFNLVAFLLMDRARKISLAALKAAELFIAEELEVRQCSFIPLTGPDESDADYIASAQRALDAVRCAIAKGTRVCSLTAIAIAADSPNFPQLRLDAEQAFRSANKAVRGITYWNDRPERTWPQVVEGFTKAIDFARAA